MSDKLILTLDTGEVTIETFPDKAPEHVARIKELADEGFYDGIPLHRVIDGFMAQMGCPRGDGTGGSKKPNLKAEFNDVSHQRGVCSMARAQNPNSANSQFFIVFDDASFLDGQYTAWGQVVDGMEHVDAAQRGEPPRNPTKIVSFRTAA
jgi:peptidylprolyl isomerase